MSWSWATNCGCAISASLANSATSAARTGRNTCLRVGTGRPKCFRKEGYTDKADMWSLGCLLHKIVHGDVPGTDLDEIVRYVPSLSGTGEMNVLIKNLLHMDPAERWSAETALTFFETTLHTLQRYVCRADTDPKQAPNEMVQSVPRSVPRRASGAGSRPHAF